MYVYTYMYWHITYFLVGITFCLKKYLEQKPEWKVSFKIVMRHGYKLKILTNTLMNYFSVLGSDLIMPWELSSGEELSFPIPCQQMALCTIGEQVIYQYL